MPIVVPMVIVYNCKLLLIVIVQLVLLVQLVQYQSINVNQSLAIMQELVIIWEMVNLVAHAYLDIREFSVKFNQIIAYQIHA